MRSGARWSRRRFLAVSGGTAAAGLRAFGQGDGIPRDTGAADTPYAQTAAAKAALPPEVISGGTQPLMVGHTARPLRYKPVNGEFVIRNGKEFFNRRSMASAQRCRLAISAWMPGTCRVFAVSAGARRELEVGVHRCGWEGLEVGAQADEVVARYRPGRMIYEIRDALLGKGTMRVELLTAGVGQGLMVKVEGQGVPAGLGWEWAFGGVSGKKGSAAGISGVRSSRVSQFFQVRAEECVGNTFTFASADASGHPSANLQSKAAELALTFPMNAQISVADSSRGEHPSHRASAWRGCDGQTHPVLIGSAELTAAPVLLAVDRVVAGGGQPNDVAATFATRSIKVDAVADSLRIETPDEYVNAAGAALGVAAETIWDAKQECVMHGGVAWRSALAGWRGPYVLDALGEHDRAKLHFRHWLKKQNVTAVTTADPAVGPPDAKNNMSRKEGLLHSNGDLSNNHYDMNLVFFDVLLRHLMWTGDVEFAREAWPSLQRHLAWEHRLFRRTFKTANGRELPLYEAYAAIWASDNLQYNGGGAAHSSAYNVFALRATAKVAKMLGVDGSAYEAEAAAVHAGMNELLWVKGRGMYAESKDLLGPQTVYTNPALWTVYHTVDSEVPDARQAWQMVAERLAALKKVPVHGEDVPGEGLYMLACSDWLPYVWSLNLLLMGENMHMALAMWQVGMRDEAFRLFKGTLLDSMYMGLCPGDFHMTSALDAHRQEAQRDFGDPIGCSSRALVEGLFGVQPDLIAGEVRIRPGFPTGWDRASLKHKDFDLAWKRVGMRETYEFTSRLSRPSAVVLTMPARTTSLPMVTVAGNRVECSFDAEAVGGPVVEIKLPAGRTYQLSVEWRGKAPVVMPGTKQMAMGEALTLPVGVFAKDVHDPQGCLTDGLPAVAGFHTVFAKMREGECSWVMPISFEATGEQTEFAAVPALPSGAKMQHVDLSPAMKGQVTEMFTRGYAEPRSPYCSLAIPDTILGGWANPDGMVRLDDTGLRAAGGMLKTGLGVEFATPAGSMPNCVFVSYWKQDAPAAKVALSGRATGVYLLMTGTTFPQCSRMVHGTVSVTYADGSVAKLALRNPENWWPIEQDYLLDDYFFVNEAPPPPRVDLRTGKTRVLEMASFKGKGRTVQGGAATILHLPLDAKKELASMTVQAEMYGVVVGLLAATLVRA